MSVFLKIMSIFLKIMSIFLELQLAYYRNGTWKVIKRKLKPSISQLVADRDNSINPKTVIRLDWGGIAFSMRQIKLKAREPTLPCLLSPF
jgi:hypothetical protein